MSNRLASILRDDVVFEKAPSVTDWLEANIVIPPEMSPKSPGPFRIHARPFMREVLECWHPFSGVRSCTFAGAAQDAAKTTTMVGGMVYRMRWFAMPGMGMGPSESWALEKLVKERLHPLIEANDCLKALRPANKDLFTNAFMAMRGGAWNIVGANSSTSLAGGTKGIVAIDEAAKIEHIVREDAPEAHPILNAYERTKDFKGIDFHWMSATPNTPNHLFWQTVEAGTYTHFHVPCPHCGHCFPFEFTQDSSHKIETGCQDLAKPDYYRSVVWSPDARGKRGKWDEQKIIDTVRYICPKNGCEIEEKHRIPMIRNYRAVDHNLEARKSNRSFRVPGFYGPNTRFAEMALKFIQKNGGGLQAFYNSWLALPWTALDYNIKDEHILNLRGTYARKTLPFKPALLIFTADPGESLTHWMVSAIDNNGAIFVIDWGTVYKSSDILRAEFLSQRRYTIDGTGETMMPHRGYIDSGHQTEEQYKVCKASGGFLHPTKGREAAFGSWGRSNVQAWPGMELYTYSDDQAKDALYGKLIARREKPGLHLPEDADADLLMGLTGQQKDKQTGKWKKVANDHYGDCLKEAVIASWIAEPLLSALRK